MRRVLSWISLWLALTLSGAAGLVNQVVWQRALKIFLGGSETLSAMVVVLVFMAGLGLGAWLAGLVTPRLRAPLAALAGAELALAGVTGAVAWLLGLDLSESVHAAQRLALGAGVPLRLVYGVGASALLLVPTCLMGATVPLASEAAQRQLRAHSPRLLVVLFFVNTLGAAGGALWGSLWLLPTLGQQAALLSATACNLGAAGVLWALAWVTPSSEPPAPRTPGPHRSWRLTHDEQLGFLLGFLALGYEMVLFRLLALAHEPLPTTFAVGLALFLLAWSAGVFLAGYLPPVVPPLALGTSLCIAAMPVVYGVDVEVGFSLWWGGLLYFLPPLGFGLLYGVVVARAAHAWGRDVGRYAGVNTLGSCLGVLCFTLVGYELPQTHGLVLVALGVGALTTAELAVTERYGRVLWGLIGAIGVVMLGVLLSGWTTRYTESEQGRTYWGRDGVVEVLHDGTVFIDGLWHTKLTDGEDHLGRPYSWLMAFAAVLAHREPPKRALVVGAGVGISSVTLAGVEGLQVDGYEINHTLRRVLEDYPAQTLHALDRPNVRWIWQDARTGMALNEDTYDVILSAPLHLRQAGSSLLLSSEYLRLAKRRLNPGGVLAVYSNEGSEAQTLLIQRTLAEHFPYQVSWYDGVVTLASDHPLSLSRREFEQCKRRDDRLYQELVRLESRLDDEGYAGVWSWYDGEALSLHVADRLITDDQPLIEYPAVAEELVVPVRRDGL